MKKLFGLTIVLLLSISVLAVFADALSTSSGAKTYVSQKELSAHVAERTQQSLDYARNHMLASSKPKTKVYQTLNGIHTIEGASAKKTRTIMTSAMYRAMADAEANQNRIFSDVLSTEVPEYISHADLVKMSTENSIKSKEMVRARMRARFRVGGMRGY